MTTQQILAVVLGGGLLAWQFSPWLSSLFGKLRLPAIGGPAAPADQDVRDLAALKQVQARYERMGCAEGKAACQVLFAHFFHDAGHA